MTWAAYFVKPDGSRGDQYQACDDCKHREVCRLPLLADSIGSMLTAQDSFCGQEGWANGNAELKCSGYEPKKEVPPADKTEEPAKKAAE